MIKQSMNFEDEVSDCILQYNPDAKIYAANKKNETNIFLCGKSVFVRANNILFHLLSIDLINSNLSLTYFQEKSLEFAAKGIQLVHVWQDYWITKQTQVRSRIAAMSGVFSRIHARQACVKRITRNIVFDFLQKNHLQGFVNARYHYGLFYNEDIVATASFSAARKITRNGKFAKSHELVRYSNLLNYRVTGGLGKIITHFIKEVKPDDIMTYADLDWATGAGYRALNFELTDITPPQTFTIHPNEMIRYYPHRLPQNLIEEFNKQKNEKSIENFLKENGYVKVYNSGNLKFLLSTKN